MTISERLFQIMKEKNVSMPDLSRMTGISRHTIYDWQKKNTNPGADKIIVICRALQITPEKLLAGVVKDTEPGDMIAVPEDEIEMRIMKECRKLSDAQKKRLLAYVSKLLRAGK